ncbi:MAG: O-antigen ligase family protein [Alphaproteobacteria bacterium]
MAPPPSHDSPSVLDPSRVLSGAALVVFPIAILAPMQLASLLALTAILLLCASWRAKTWPASPWAALAPAMALGAWATLSLLWAIDWKLAAEEVLRFALALAGIAVLMAAANGLDREGRVRVSRHFVRGALAGAIFLTFEIFTRGLVLKTLRGFIHPDVPFLFSTAFNRATAVIAILVWPLALALLRRRAWRLTAIIPLLWGLWAIVSLDKHASAIALLAGLATFALSWLSGRLATAVFCVAAILTITLAPIVPRLVLEPKNVASVFPDISFSEYHRLIIWRFTAERIADRPLLGWGMNSSRAIPGGKDLEETAIPERAPRGSGDNPGERLPLHPHSAPLQLWLELGLPGAALGAAFAAGLAWRLRRTAFDRPARAAALGAMASAGIIFAMSFSLWQSWWLATLGLGAAFLIAAPRGECAR